MKMKNAGIVQKIAIFVICIGVLSYSVYHLSSLFSDSVSYIIADKVTEEKAINVNGYIFRNETVLTSDYTGICDYSIADGTKITKDKLLATVYEKGSDRMSVVNSLSSLNKQIKLFEECLNSNKKMSDIPELRESAKEFYYYITNLLALGEISNLHAVREKFLLALFEMDKLANREGSIENSLEVLYAAKKSLLDGSGSKVQEFAPGSGYFYSYADGLEDYFTIEAIDSATYANFNLLVSKQVYGSVSVPANAYGRLSSDSEWKFAFIISSDNDSYFSVNKYYPIEFSANGGTELSMELENKIYSADNKSIVLVFRSNMLPAGFVFARSQSVRVSLERITGLYVPKTALYKNRSRTGVYVLRGSVVAYRSVEIIYEGQDFYLVKDGEGSVENRVYLSRNEQIITKGSNLFDGRILSE